MPDPYFTPAAGTQLAFRFPPSYTHAGALGAVNTHHFYVVQGVACSGGNTNSMRVGEFEFALVPGS